MRSLIVALLVLCASAWLSPLPAAFAAGAPLVAQEEIAIKRWTDAIQAARLRGDDRAGAEALARRAESYQTLGHRQEALADLRAAAALVEPHSASSLKAAILGALGQAYLRAGRADDADRVLADALAIAQKSNNARIAAAILNDRGNLYAAAARRDDAERAYAASLEQARIASDRLAEGKAQLNLGRLNLRHGNIGAAQRSASDAATAFRALPESSVQATNLTAAGRLLRELSIVGPAELVGQARDVLTLAVAISERTQTLRARAEALGQLAELAVQQGEFAPARQLNESALFSAQSTNAADVQFFAQWRAAKLLERAGDADGAVPAYRRALASLAQIKTDLAAELWAAQESFTERIGPAYLGLADLLLRRASSTSDTAAKRAALREIQQTLESFRQVELEDYFRDDCVARYLARARGIEQVSARTAVIYPVPLTDRLELVVSIGEAIHQVTVPVGFAELDREARALRALLEKRTTYQYLPHARRLYDRIIRPLEAILTHASVDTLVLIPDRPLRNIPLAALNDGKDFLVAKFAIAIAPSLTLVEPTPLRTEHAVVLASGLTESVQGFAALPYVGSELESFRNLRIGTTLRDQSFTTTNLERELSTRPYSVVHLASHAQFNADSRRSFLLTYDGRLTIDRLEDHMKQNRYRDAPVELLFLSACQTAAGDERAALGLAGVAVKAGARSALASLWHINDQASSLLVSEFYRQLGEPGVSKAEALRRAQVSLLSDLRYRHPGYWSPFLVIGNWL
jgi:CHAT domain-containing protein